MDDTTENDAFDAARLTRYIERYQETDDHEEQRRIEDLILGETVWTETRRSRDEELVIKKAELIQLYQSIPDDALEAKRILRELFIED